jgi:hypothetical protein
MKLLYKPIGLFVSVLGGLIAGALFKRLWRAVANESDAPQTVHFAGGELELRPWEIRTITL